MQNEILIYQTRDGKTQIDVTFQGETVWLTQKAMAELFGCSSDNISLHLKNIFNSGELDKNSVTEEFSVTATDGKNYLTKHYNLDAIISVGYRVNSSRATQFRIWATQVLKEYLRKGFALNDDLLKKAGGGGYWQELLERIRDIRSSEKVFYRQILDIYATSIDYNPNSDETKLFFKAVQNKMHFAAHGHTAPEVIYLRADSTKDNMGLTVFSGSHPRKDEVTIAKNYLTKDELDILNRITSAYLEFAELQAIRHNQMTMKDWVKKLDDFIKMSGSELLKNAGTISKLEAENKALMEYSKYKETIKYELSEVEKHFLESVKNVQKQITKKAKDNKTK